MPSKWLKNQPLLIDSTLQDLLPSIGALRCVLMQKREIVDFKYNSGRCTQLQRLRF